MKPQKDGPDRPERREYAAERGLLEEVVPEFSKEQAESFRFQRQTIKMLKMLGGLAGVAAAAFGYLGTHVASPAQLAAYESRADSSRAIIIARTVRNEQGLAQAAAERAELRAGLRFLIAAKCLETSAQTRRDLALQGFDCGHPLPTLPSSAGGP